MIERSERRWVWIFGCAAAVLTTLPYLVGYYAAGESWRYSGLLLASEDGYSYLAKMLLGSNGDWLFRTPYTAFPQAGFIAFLPYILLGKLVAGLGRAEQLVALFHWFRISGVLACTWATYSFTAIFVEEPGLRRLATGLSLFGGGLGFLGLFGLNGLWQGVMKMPLEYYSPETFGFLSLLALPHLVWARALLLWGLGLVLRREDLRSGIWVGCLWLALGLMQPLTVVTAWAVHAAQLIGWGGWKLIRQEGLWDGWRKELLRAGLSVLISSPIVVYTWLAFRLDPFLSRWQARNLIPSPPPGDYLLAFGLVLPLSVIGIWTWRRSLNQKRILLVAWLTTFPILAYLPFNLQRRLPEGIWVALCILAVVGLNGLRPLWNKPARYWLYTAFITSAVLFLGALMGVSRPSEPLFRPAAEFEAMNTLAEIAGKEDVVLAAYETSTVIPASAPVSVLIGHGPESLDLETIKPRVEAFFSSQTGDGDRQILLSEFRVTMLFYGPNEKRLGNWDPSEACYLRVVYNQDGYQIFRLEDCSR